MYVVNHTLPLIVIPEIQRLLIPLEPSRMSMLFGLEMGMASHLHHNSNTIRIVDLPQVQDIRKESALWFSLARNCVRR